MREQSPAIKMRIYYHILAKYENYYYYYYYKLLNLFRQ